MADNRKSTANFDKFPEKQIKGFEAWAGWNDIRGEILKHTGKKFVITAEFYPEIYRDEIIGELKKLGGAMADAEMCTITDEQYQAKIREYLTDDRVFGVMNTLKLEDIYVEEKTEQLRNQIESMDGLVVVYGVGASLVTTGDMLLYFDMPRWEIQCRFRKGMPNWKSENPEEEKLRKFKQGFFVEWRMADRRKKKLLETIDFIVDTVIPGEPKMVSGAGFREGLCTMASEPFRLVPYYAPEVWGGQWMKEVCDLDREMDNYAWSFDGVPEENSIYMRFGNVRMEFPSVDVVFYCPKKLLGNRVHARFGDEFPIRFDFLDTMGGQNLSLQVHPVTEYIQNTFGMHYTQDESYYIMDCKEDAEVYLGTKEGVDAQEMMNALSRSDVAGEVFPAETFINTWKVKKHDHYLIPAGTIHCSGKDTVVLEISATPYIFTFKLWDWGRLGLDGKPRPVHIDHGSRVIDWSRTTEWVGENLVNHMEPVCGEPGFTAVKTGLHEREFIETVRYQMSESRIFTSDGSVSMCNVVEGSGAVISSPCGNFEPFEVHYAETFIIPADVEEFEITPLEENCMILRASVR